MTDMTRDEAVEVLRGYSQQHGNPDDFDLALAALQAQGEPVAAKPDIYEAYKTWPADIRAKLSLHDLRRMNGWTPAAKPDAVAGLVVAGWQYRRAGSDDAWTNGTEYGNHQQNTEADPEWETRLVYALPHAHPAPQQPAAVDGAIAWVRLRGSQGEPPGAMTVTAELRDGREIVLIRDNGNEIDHAVNLSAALAAQPRGSDNER